MPELPDIVVYIEALAARVVGHRLTNVRISGPSLLRSHQPPLEAAFGRPVRAVHRIGKRIVIDLGDGLFLVLHLMIAGRLVWKALGASIPKKVGLAAFDFDSGTLLLTEASTRKRASLHLVAGEDSLRQHDRGGLEVMDVQWREFAARLRSENHTLKRALSDPRLFSGIGNAYSDEILHRAKLSPMMLTSRLTDTVVQSLHRAAVEVLTEWTERLRAEARSEFPSKVTAFRPEMAVHGRFRKPCPVCGAPIQRIVYAANQTNYCPGCQTEGKILADRSLSRLLRDDWPRSLDELEELGYAHRLSN